MFIICTIARPDHVSPSDHLIANGAEEKFDHEKNSLHMKCLAEGIEVLKQQIQEKCGSA
ncbi:hypothetical protein [Methylomarinum vadi]|uniref:hypothetical protein n=1 Tax=Methylomarinum vadi TaxID=438855 RepID=UPI00136206D0|nr:hypothetical protein [Methylomarinum vadi]